MPRKITIYPKHSLEEIALATCRAMAEQCLYPKLFESFIEVHNELIERRHLQNEKISTKDEE